MHGIGTLGPLAMFFIIYHYNSKTNPCF